MGYSCSSAGVQDDRGIPIRGLLSFGTGDVISMRSLLPHPDRTMNVGLYNLPHLKQLLRIRPVSVPNKAWAPTTEGLEVQ